MHPLHIGIGERTIGLSFHGHPSVARTGNSQLDVCESASRFRTPTDHTEHRTNSRWHENLVAILRVINQRQNDRKGRWAGRALTADLRLVVGLRFLRLSWQPPEMDAHFSNGQR